jgi:hypothetical protein
MTPSLSYTQQQQHLIVVAAASSCSKPAPLKIRKEKKRRSSISFGMVYKCHSIRRLFRPEVALDIVSSILV